jgi:hypothetical protein
VERFNIVFHMNNGEIIQFMEEHEEGFDFKSSLNNSKKWFRHDEKIINLNNVNYVDVRTESKNRELEGLYHQDPDEDFEFWN